MGRCDNRSCGSSGIRWPGLRTEKGVTCNGKPAGDFVDLKSVAPSIIVDIRYAGPHNFVGRPIPGYDADKCLLTRPAAEAVASVQQKLTAFGLSLLVYDCYRPQRGGDYFVKWAAGSPDNSMKREFYPHVKKDDLFKDGYIASPSSHSRGSTVDLTIVPLPRSNIEVYAPGDPSPRLLRAKFEGSMKFILPLLLTLLVPLLLRVIRIPVPRASTPLTPRQQNIRALMLWAGLAVVWVVVWWIFR